MKAIAATNTHTGTAAAAADLADRLSAVADARAVLLYATVNHDLPALVGALRDRLGPGVALVGCSAQGVVARDFVAEEGYAVGAVAFGGEGLRVSHAHAPDVARETRAKGEALARGLRLPGGEAPRLAVILYDPLSGVDVTELLQGFAAHLPEVIVIGGAASQPWGQLVRTHLFHGAAVSSGSAVALGLGGDFEVVTGQVSGAEPTGIEMTITRSEGNRLLEIDGRPALEVWQEMVGSTEGSADDIAAWAVGVRRPGAPPTSDADPEGWALMAAFGLEAERKAVVLQASVAAGSRVMFHHRTVDAVLHRTLAMGDRLQDQLDGRRPLAVLTFECGARASPFLGPERTLQENVELQRRVAPGAPWLGLLAWGEIAARAGDATFCNYTYPLAVITAP